MKHLIIFLLMASAVLQSNAQEKIFTLQQSIDTALKNNILVKQAGLNDDVAAINLKQSKNNMLPDLSGNFAYGFNQGRNVDPLTNNYINQQLNSSNVVFGTGIILYNGMRLQNQVKQNKTNKAAAEKALQYSKDDLVLKVIQAYLQIMSSKEVAKITTSQLDVTKNQLDRMAILVKEGVVGNYQYTDLEGQYASEEISMLDAGNSLQAAKLNICQLMNIEYDSSINFLAAPGSENISKYGKTVTEVYNTSLQNFALLKLEQLNVKSAEQGVAIARGSFAPTISFNANIGSNFSSLAKSLSPTTITEINTGNYVTLGGIKQPVLTSQQNYSFSKTGYFTQLSNNLGTFFGINVSLPLFTRFQTKTNVALAKKTLSNQQFELDKIEQQLKQDIEKAYLDMTTAFSRYEVLQRQVASFNESFRAAAIRYEAGSINSVEYLLVKNNLDRAVINHTISRYEYLFRTKLLDFYESGRR